VSGVVYDGLLSNGAPALPDEHYYEVRWRHTLGMTYVKARVKRRVWLPWLPGYAWSRQVTPWYEAYVRDEDARSAISAYAYVCARTVQEGELLSAKSKRERHLAEFAGKHGPLRGQGA